MSNTNIYLLPLTNPKTTDEIVIAEMYSYNSSSISSYHDNHFMKNINHLLDSYLQFDINNIPQTLVLRNGEITKEMSSAIINVMSSSNTVKVIINSRKAIPLLKYINVIAGVLMKHYSVEVRI